MPVLDWTRTSVDRRLDDGSLAYDPEELAATDASRGPTALQAWSPPEPDRLPGLLAEFRRMDCDELWENLAHFLEAVVPVAVAAGVRMAIHPDDPPWPVFGLPRIVTDGPALQRLVSLVDSPANGITFCTVVPDNPVGDAAMAKPRRFGVDTRLISRGGERLGLYFPETGANRRPSRVVYDRTGSSMATASPDAFDWDAVFSGADSGGTAGPLPKSCPSWCNTFTIEPPSVTSRR